MSLQVEIHGGGAKSASPPLILIHGAGGSRLHWPPGIRRLAGSRVLAVDLPGHGRSPGPGQTSIEAYADLMLAWLEENEPEPVIPVGHSMGGAIALTLALQVPERLAALVLVGSGARLRVAPAILEASAQPDTFPQAVDAIMRWAFSETASARLVELARRRMLEVDPAVLHDDFAACNAFDVMSRLESIALPTLVLCGAQDQLTPPRYSEFLAEKIPGAKLVHIPQAGHMVMLERPQAVAGALQEFRERLPSRS
jgi:pimeloyl-ACP methyl ester carboxylesterase